MTIKPNNLHLDCKSFIFCFHCLYRQLYSTIKSILHLKLNHFKNFFTSKPCWKIMVKLPCWLLGSSSAIDISHHTPCINANQCSCVVWNLLALTCPFAWYSGNTIRPHLSSPKTRETLLALSPWSFSGTYPLRQFLFKCPYIPHFSALCNPDCISTSLTCTFHKAKLIVPSNFSMSNFIVLE